MNTPTEAPYPPLDTPEGAPEQNPPPRPRRFVLQLTADQSPSESGRRVIVRGAPYCVIKGASKCWARLPDRTVLSGAYWPLVLKIIRHAGFTPVTELSLGARLEGFLMRGGWLTVEDLHDADQDGRLAAIPYIGPRALDALRTALARWQTAPAPSDSKPF